MDWSRPSRFDLADLCARKTSGLDFLKSGTRTCKNIEYEEKMLCFDNIPFLIGSKKVPDILLKTIFIIFKI